MFMVGEEAAEAIQRAYHETGEEAAVIELRRFFKIEDNEAALRSVRMIASWRRPATLPPARRSSPNRRPR